MIGVEVTQLVRDEGSVVLFRGQELDENGVDYKGSVTFACDHRPAYAIAQALEEGEPDIYVELDEWQIISRIPNTEE